MARSDCDLIELVADMPVWQIKRVFWSEIVGLTCFASFMSMTSTVRRVEKDEEVEGRERERRERQRRSMAVR